MSRKPSVDIGDFYLSKLTHRSRSRVLENSSDHQFAKPSNLLKSKSNWKATLEKSTKEFEESKQQQVMSEVLLGFPSETRDFLEGQSAKTKVTVKSHFVTFEKSMHCLEDVHSQVSAYKPDLGLVMSHLLADLRQVWISTIGAMVSVATQMQIVEEDTRAQILENHKEDQREKRLLELRIESLNNVILFKNASLEINDSKLESIEQQMRDLKETKSSLSIMLGTNVGGEVAQIERSANLARLENLQSEIIDLTKEYQKIEREKLKQGEHIVKLDLLTKQNFYRLHKDFEVQVDEAELMWGLTSLKREVHINPEFSHLNDRVSAIVYNPNSTFEDPLRYVAASTSPGSSDKDAMSVSSFMFTDAGQLSMTSPDRRRRKGQLKKKVVVAPLPVNSIVWQVPFGLCRFLEDVHAQYTEVSIISWHTFRHEIFQLLEERLVDDWEIVGSPTNAVIPFEEYLILYFVRKTTHLRLAALKLLEFLSSLKFYAEKWKRAYLCALVCNLMRRKSHGIYDYYLQNYFLFLYSYLFGLKEFWIENDSTTYIQFDRLHDFLASALEFLEQDRYSREIGGFEMKTQVFEGVEGLIELDEVLFSCVNLFLEEYTRRIEVSLKTFKLQCNRKGKDVSLKEFTRVIEDAYPSKTTLRNLSFGSSLTRTRAFVLFCTLYSGKKRVAQTN